MTTGSILIVDDDPAHRLLARRALLKHLPMLAVLESGSCNDAMNLISIAENRPLLIFLDLNLGGESGMKFLKALRQTSWGGSIPVVVLSTSALDEDVKDAYHTKANAFMVKNPSPEKYQEDVKKAALFFLRPTLV